MAYDSSQKKTNGSFHRRALLIGAGQVAGFGLLSGRLYQLQVLEGQFYAPLAENNRISIQLLAPVRGRILDRKGAVLADNEEQFGLSVIPALTQDLERTLAQISEIVPLSAAQQKKLIINASSAGLNRPLVVADDLTFQQIAAINVLAPQLPGVETQTTYRRRYRAGAAMAHITGYTGEVEKRALDDDPVLRLPGIRTGKIGVELGLESRLRGSAGRRKFEVDARGRIIRNLETQDAQSGEDLRLTIDSDLQTRVMSRLSGERRAALVVLNVGDGAILSLASVPTFDVDQISARLSAEQWKALSEGKDQPMFNRTIRGLYPPGSTFKMVTALAALEAGVIDVKKTVECEGRYTLADQSYHCWKRHGHGPMNLHQALRESCDTYFYELAKRCGISAIASVAHRLGFGQVFDCGLPLQKKGVVPSPDWKRWRFNASWLDGETVLAGIGQGYVSATPLQLAVMTARLASGRQIVPSLVAEDGTTRKAAKKLDFDPAHLTAVRAGMLASIYEMGGTGARAQIAGANFSIAGKTGTSQVRSNSTRRKTGEAGWQQRDHALFVCFFPVDKPRYAIACVVEHGGSGGKTAAPLVREVIKDVVDYDRTAPRSSATNAKKNMADG
ncbi:MAG: penicillin-binding protein 2 [Alphaproteobacteria bacterium]|nr:penicillin-binding protein 2 [Alphaproteobacteria bacterium]